MDTTCAAFYTVKKMDNATKTWSIPQEIIFEIFSNLPVKPLMRFRCVSKSCNSLIASNSIFHDIHQCRSMTRPGGTTFLVHERKAFYTIEQKEEDGKASLLRIEQFDKLYYYGCRIMCVDGLFCIWNRNAYEQPSVAIFNPSKKEVRILPKLKDHTVDLDDLFPIYFVSLGFDPEEKKYMLLMTVNIEAMSTRNWIFTLGIDESWREAKKFAIARPVSVAIASNSSQLRRVSGPTVFAFAKNPSQLRSKSWEGTGRKCDLLAAFAEGEFRNCELPSHL
ncbi:PREDICTED: F-box protein At1g52490-like [Nicotiana attenuata]|uniref:F-box protein At1g52490-like n=1 Tax=Nicotiana attenuata TaxID=49451 RepID=UPI000905B78D|nr:PREDICTED: F-box protein At1g52490-like [Nicotiana attenuata]